MDFKRLFRLRQTAPTSLAPERQSLPPRQPGVLKPLTIEDRFGEVEIRTDPLELHTAEDVVFVPDRPGNQWGLFDPDDQPLEASLDYVFSWNQPMRARPISPVRYADVETTLPDADYIYVGYVHTHFGHFLTDTLSRFWPLLQDRWSEARLLFHGWGTPSEWWAERPWMVDIFSALGVGRGAMGRTRRPSAGPTPDGASTELSGTSVHLHRSRRTLPAHRRQVDGGSPGKHKHWPHILLENKTDRRSPTGLERAPAHDFPFKSRSGGRTSRDGFITRTDFLFRQRPNGVWRHGLWFSRKHLCPTRRKDRGDRIVRQGELQFLHARRAERESDFLLSSAWRSSTCGVSGTSMDVRGCLPRSRRHRPRTAAPLVTTCDVRMLGGCVQRAQSAP